MIRHPAPGSMPRASPAAMHEPDATGCSSGSGRWSISGPSPHPAESEAGTGREPWGRGVPRALPEVGVTESVTGR